MDAAKIDPNLKRQLGKSKLRYISDKAEGISRSRVGQNFGYLYKGQVKDKKTLQRIQSLSIPPAWENVWICPSDFGHLQATGFDEKGRKQYLYHDEWSEICKQNKFDKMIDFGKFLPEIRQKVNLDMNKSSRKQKILATIVWLLENTLIRVGNEEYVKENNSFGLTTLRNRHVKVRGQNIKFEFKGKSSILHTVSVTHSKIAKIIKECIELPGYEIFQYVDDAQKKHSVDSSDVNDYLQSITGEDVTAKDFRTWGGTSLAAATLHNLGQFKSADDALKNLRIAVSKVASHLRNTPAICKNYYIHPTVIETYQKNMLIPHFNASLKTQHNKPNFSRTEFALLTLLQNYS